MARSKPSPSRQSFEDAILDAQLREILALGAMIRGGPVVAAPDLTKVKDLADYNSRPARQLAPPELRKALPTDEEFTVNGGENPPFHAKFFTPTGYYMAWYVAAGDPDTNGVSAFKDDYFFYGYVVHQELCPRGEWATFSLRVLERVHCGMFVGIERDLHFKPLRLSRVQDEIDAKMRELGTVPKSRAKRKKGPLTMAQDTAIEWTDKTWNPTRGCSRVSEGCRYCYAEQVAGRFCGPGLAYEGLATRGPKGARWAGDVKFIERELVVPLRTRKPTRFFVNSMSDLFHERLDERQIRQVFNVILQSPQHDYQILTKRSGRLRELAPSLPWPSNLWMGVSIESPKYLGRLDDLLATPAQVKFLSLEPLLARMPNLRLEGISWVIVGGESGHHLITPAVCAKRALVEKVGKLWVPRPDRIDWVREIRDACAAQRVPFLFKQWGGLRPKSAGRELDGTTHDEFPRARRHLPLVRP